MDQPKDSGYTRLESQISWYDRKSRNAQSLYKTAKILVITLSALIPVMSVLGWMYVVAACGAIIAIAEGLQHLYQWQHNWITYRSTCEALKHEKFTFMECANPYDIEDDRERRRLLAERIESLISTEHSKWIANQEEAARSKMPGAPRGAKSPD